MLKDEGLPSLRYQFKTLLLNGKNLGSYAIEEHFDKFLLENSGYREGPIIKFSEENMWLEAERRYKIFQRKLPTKELTSGEQNSEIIPFNQKKVSLNESKYNQYLRAKSLLSNFLEGKVKVEEVFDINLTAKFFAINDLLLVSHSNSWNNIRFYYNPITGKLIPIGYDADVPITNDYGSGEVVRRRKKLLQ